MRLSGQDDLLMPEPMMRKFKEGPFKELAFRKLPVPGDDTSWDLEFWNGKKIRVTKGQYATWPEKDCVTNR